MHITWDEDCIHIRVIKINTTQLKWIFLFLPFPTPSIPSPYPHFFYFLEPSKSSWTTWEKILGWGSIGQVNPQKYELFWLSSLLQRRQQGAVTHRGTISLCCCGTYVLAFAGPPSGCTPTRWHISETGTPALHSSTPEWPASPAAENAAKLHYEARWNNPPATFIALPKTGRGKSFNSPSKIQTALYLISVGTYLVPLSTPDEFLVS